MMDSLKEAIREAAEQHFGLLKNVAPHLDSLLFSRKKGRHAVMFGSFVNGTYTNHSDIDVFIQNNSTQYGSGESRVLNLSQLLKKNHGIESEVTGNILFFTFKGVKINAVAERPHKITQSQERDTLISTLVARFPLYCDVVRFFKQFASTYIERFPHGRQTKPIYPGSHFYTIVTALALNLFGTGARDLAYKDAIREVAKYIGEDEYMTKQSTLEQYGLNPSSKFHGIRARENFNKCFRALAAHVERNVPLPHFDGVNIPEEKPISELLVLTHDDEALRERLAREKEMQLLDHVDDDSGYVGSNEKRYLACWRD